MKLIKTFPYYRYVQLGIDAVVDMGCVPQIMFTTDAQDANGVATNVLNVSAQAIANFKLTETEISFDYSSGGKGYQFSCHPADIIHVFARDAEGFSVFPVNMIPALCRDETDAGKEFALGLSNGEIKPYKEDNNDVPDIKLVSDKDEKKPDSNIVRLFPVKKD